MSKTYIPAPLPLVEVGAVYFHYANHKAYEVLAVADMPNSHARYVVYRPLYVLAEFEGKVPTYVRPVAEFVAKFSHA